MSLHCRLRATVLHLKWIGILCNGNRWKYLIGFFTKWKTFNNRFNSSNRSIDLIKYEYCISSTHAQINGLVGHSIFLNSKRFVSLTRRTILCYSVSMANFLFCCVRFFTATENRFSSNERQYERSCRLSATVLSCYVLNINKLWQFFSSTTQFGADFLPISLAPIRAANIFRVLPANHDFMTFLTFEKSF